MTHKKHLTNKEAFFDKDEIIVSKTNLKGRLTYCNDVFLRIAGFTEPECVGQPHSIVRHPSMPSCIFKMLWDSLKNGDEIFAYVVNRCKNGDHYWVLAHVTPSTDVNGQVVGYHSNRRVPDRDILENTIIPLYRDLLAEEGRHAAKDVAMAASVAMLDGILSKQGMAYDEWVLTLGKAPMARAA